MRLSKVLVFGLMAGTLALAGCVTTGNTKVDGAITKTQQIADDVCSPGNQMTAEFAYTSAKLAIATFQQQGPKTDALHKTLDDSIAAFRAACVALASGAPTAERMKAAMAAYRKASDAFNASQGLR